MFSKLKIRRVILILAAAIFITALLILVLLLNRPTGNIDNKVLFEVNGEPVTVGEYKTMTLYQEHDLLQYSIELKLKQILAKEHGAMADIRYEHLLEELAQKNIENANKKKKGEIVFGKNQFSVNEYYQIRMSEMETQTKEKIGKELTILDKEARAYYEANLDSLFKGTPEIKLRKISASYADKSENDRAALLSVMQDIENKSPDGFDDLYEKYKYTPRSSLKAEEQFFNTKTLKFDSMNGPYLFKAANQLNQDEISEIIEENGSFAIIKIIEIKQTYLPFATAKDEIIRKQSEEKYKATLEAMVAKAKVDVDESLLQRIKAQ
ncbi:peptidyl-prolyl cis-trans isomerase [Paenibacillus psychroresistens]|uniref:peptidylprolyl isomerase n=1 Tax=Paenibacillus psychroresistens TaxID=1778678 RepID=A0A6B8RFZ4_9BACL|nr:peptidyl-prolyl cis-trans isomerase [Paenibacillus psychroresistens]QGQ95100.1 peptidyl-prolyl cis-trans isomerase [Paenibacillus psychroresistens]